jgi:hypothetical protein
MEKKLIAAEAGYLHDGNGNGFWAVREGAVWHITDTAAYIPLVDCAANAPGMILEFGVRGGTTIRELAQSGKEVHGFDWWKGLPYEWDEFSPKGACLAQKPCDLPQNVTLHEGLFSDTLADFLRCHHGAVGLAHLDCDLYAATIYVLHCLRDRFIPGSLIAFSAMSLFPTLSQKRAWELFLQAAGESWTMLGKHHAWGEVWRKQ